jgi:hypothetical protein
MYFLYTIVPEAILIKINGNAMYLASEPFGLSSLLLMLGAVTWTDRKIWSLRSAGVLEGGRQRGKRRREGRYNVKAEAFLSGIKWGNKSYGR